jgi:hypothetical protein
VNAARRPPDSTKLRTTHLTAGILAVVSGLHVAWGLGSTFPFATHAELADFVVGSDQVPGPLACFTVASALAGAALVLEDLPRLPSRIHQVGLATVAGVLGLRGVLGMAELTETVSPGSSSPNFRRLDRQIYSPLCLALAAGAAISYLDATT